MISVEFCTRTLSGNTCQKKSQFKSNHQWALIGQLIQTTSLVCTHPLTASRKRSRVHGGCKDNPPCSWTWPQWSLPLDHGWWAQGALQNTTKTHWLRGMFLLLIWLFFLNSQNRVFMKLDDIWMKPDQSMMSKVWIMTVASKLIKFDDEVTGPIPHVKHLGSLLGWHFNTTMVTWYSLT